MLRLVAAVRDVNQCESDFGVEPQNLGAQLAAQSLVEAGERFVHQQNARPQRKGTREGDALLLPAR